jgi:hypothetical protein
LQPGFFAIARNLRIDRLRREVPWQELPEERLEAAASEALPDEALAEKERQVRVARWLASLPPEQHEVVILSYLEGLSHGEIAERLKLPWARQIAHAYRLPEDPQWTRGPAVTITHHSTMQPLMSFAAGSLPAALSASGSRPRCHVRALPPRDNRGLERVGGALLAELQPARLDRAEPSPSAATSLMDITQHPKDGTPDRDCPGPLDRLLDWRARIPSGGTGSGSAFGITAWWLPAGAGWAVKVSAGRVYPGARASGAELTLVLRGSLS